MCLTFGSVAYVSHTFTKKFVSWSKKLGLASSILFFSVSQQGRVAAVQSSQRAKFHSDWRRGSRAVSHLSITVIWRRTNVWVFFVLVAIMCALGRFWIHQRKKKKEKKDCVIQKAHSGKMRPLCFAVSLHVDNAEQTSFTLFRLSCILSVASLVRCPLRPRAIRKPAYSFASSGFFGLL